MDTICVSSRIDMVDEFMRAQNAGSSSLGVSGYSCLLEVVLKINLAALQGIVRG